MSPPRSLQIARALPLAAGLLAAAHAAAQDRIEPIPEVPLAAMERAVRQQLEERLDALERLRSGGQQGTEELAGAYGSLARLFLGYDLDAAAGACLRNAIRLAPDVFAWHYYLGRLYQRRHELAAAAAAYERALELEPGDLPTLVRLGNTLLAAGRPEAATVRFRAALGVDPASAAAHAGLGRAAIAQGPGVVESDYRQAVAHFEKAVALQPQATRLHYQLGLAYRELGELEKARYHLERSGPGRVRFADPLGREVARVITGTAAYITLGRLALRRGGTETAEGYFRQAVASNPRSSPARQNLGQVLERQGRVEEALAEYAAALRLDPGLADLHYHLGRLLAERARAEEARRHLRTAVELVPGFREALVALAELEAARGELEGAADLLRRAVELDPLDETIAARLQAIEKELAANRE